MDCDLRLLGVGVAIRLMGKALYTAFFALYFVDVLGATYLSAGVIYLGIGLIQLPFGHWSGNLTDRLGRVSPGWAESGRRLVSWLSRLLSPSGHWAE